MADQNTKSRQDRAKRTRKKIAKVANGRPRLSIYRSAKNISAQIIDDKKGLTVASASSLDESLQSALASDGDKSAAASVVGKAVAERAIAAGVKDVVFDRGGYMYHGRVRALADAAREAGLKF